MAEEDEAEAGRSVGEKAAGAALPSALQAEEKPAADDDAADSNEEEEEIFVMSKDELEYILSWDYAEDKFDRGEDNDAAWIKACDHFRKIHLELHEYQQRVREEYDEFGYVVVDPAKYTDEYKKKMAEEDRAAFYEVFGPDFKRPDSDRSAGSCPGGDCRGC